jgi:outer membrane protein assembly factor BamA
MSDRLPLHARFGRMALLSLLGLAWPSPQALADAVDEALDSRSLEGAVVPLVGGDTDIGFGAGVLGSLARLDPDRRPFRWRLEGAAFATVKPRGGLEFKWPYQDVFLVYTHNGLFSERLRLEMRAAFTRETDLRYYGIGNASVAPADDEPARDFFTRSHPAGRARIRIALTEAAAVVLGSIYTFTSLDFDPSSRLAQDQVTGSPRLRQLLQVDLKHALHLFEFGMLFDTRDNEGAPSRGVYHQLELRLTPWQTDRHPYRYAEFHTTLRFYQQIVADRLVLAARAVGYVQMGDVPFYELSRYDETSALGGSKGVRGIPKNRYYGKRKTFGNIEARARLFNFRLRKSDYQLGLVGYFDGGRVWADLRSAPELDGTGWGLKYGAGGGVRLQKGATFVLRVDLAWSPDARPIGGYFLAGHLF